jgi:hypothetical protein
MTKRSEMHIVKLLLENIHAKDHQAIRYTSENGHTQITIGIRSSKR